MGTKPAPGKGLRIASGCSTLDEFTGVFRKFSTPNSIFIATKSPRPSGISIRFAITLKDGKPVMRGAGKITASFLTKDNKYARPGMVLEFAKLDPMGRILLDELNAGSKVEPLPSQDQNFEVPTLIQEPSTLALELMRPPPVVQEAPDVHTAAVESTKESAPLERTEDSRLILPANPFEGLTNTSLEEFIECTLFEETGETDISSLVAQLNDGRLGGSGDEGAGESGAPALGDFDSAPDALDDDVSRQAAAREVAEANKPAFLPRSPRLPGISDPPTQTPAPDAVRVDQDTPSQSLADMPRSFGVPEFVPPEPSVPYLDPLTVLVTRKQSALLAGICLFAGIGFGLLFSDGSSRASGAASTEIVSPAEETAPITDEVEGGVTGTSVEANPSEQVEEHPGEAIEIEIEADAAGLEDREAEHDLEPDPDGVMVAGPTLTALANPCHVILDVMPEDSEVMIGDSNIGEEATEVTLPCGSHRLQISHPRYQNHSSEIELIAGEATTISHRLERPIVALRVQSTPSQAKVSVNSRDAGSTPLSRKVRAFESVTLKISSPGYQTYTRKVYPKKSTTLNIRLRKAKPKPRSRPRAKPNVSRTKKR